MIQVNSSIDQNKYLEKEEKNKDNEKQKANKLARVHEKVNILIKSLSLNDERRILLEKAPLKLEERQDTRDVGYTVNKGEKIGICLTDDNENALFFVIMHELSHVITKEYGHTEKFWENFEYIIKQAVKLGLYNYKDYNTSPINYCEEEISYTPYKK